MGTFLYFTAKVLCFLVFRILLWTEVTGKENIPPRGPFLLASNHASFLDPPLLGLASDRKLRFLARATLYQNRFFSFLITSLGAIPLDQEGSALALKKGLNVLQRKQGLVIFPEGTRSLDGQLQPARPGIGFVARKSGAPVVPVFISGSNRVLPVHARFVRPARIRVRIGKPLVFQTDDYAEIGSRIMQAIGKLRDEK